MNDKRITEATLTNGDRIRLGKDEFLIVIESSALVAASSMPVEPVPIADAPVALPENRIPASPATVDLSPASGLPEAPPPDADAGRRFVGKAALLAVAILSGLYLLQVISDAASAKRERCHVIKRGESLVVRLGPQTKGFDEILIGPPDEGVVRANLFDGMIGNRDAINAVVVEGRRRGDTRVTLLKGGSPVGRFDVMVRGVTLREIDESGLESREEARERGLRKLLEAHELAKDQPYEALKRFKLAEDLLTRGRDKKRAEATEGASKLSLELRSKVRKFYQDAISNIKSNDTKRSNIPAAIHSLQEIQHLIPDPKSIDNQFVRQIEQLLIRSMRTR